MKTILISMIAVILLSGPSVAQYPPSGPEVTANLDSLLNAGMDEILCYLLLKREDFRFRDDYLDRDSFRLNIVDSMMAHPLAMNGKVDTCGAVFSAFDDSPDSVIRFIARLATSNITAPRETGDNSGNTRVLNWQNSRDTILSFLDNWQGTARKYIDDVLTPQQFDLVASKYQDLILEEVSDKDKSAEEQDSISNVEEKFAIDFADMAKGLPFPAIMRLQPILNILDNLKSSFESDPELRDKAARKPLYSQDKYNRRVVFGSLGDDIYEGNYDIIIDPGGNDTYHLTYDPHNPHPTIIADFSGDDIYTAETEFALACGAFANSLLIDYEGNDIYRGGNFSLGAGYFGVGILWDKKGDDSYFGDTFTQGAGTFGLGLLIDSEGSDTYTGNLFCQGFGFVNGVGGIIDKSGNDEYVVQPKYGDFIRYEDHYISLSQGFGYGIRPWLSGGWGFLFDYGGNDVYISDIFGQGGSYWWSLGMLYDKSGNDQYLSHQYAQGNGTHMSVGILRDDAGNDIYRAYGVSQGCGHDYGCGWLEDRRGDDLYATNDLGHGAGQANGIGIFTDLIGNDRYSVVGKNNTGGYGNPRRDYGSIGIFLDLDGDDKYDGNGCNDCFWTIPGSKWGGGLDRHMPIPDSADTAGVPHE